MVRNSRAAGALVLLAATSLIATACSSSGSGSAPTPPPSSAATSLPPITTSAPAATSAAPTTGAPATTAAPALADGPVPAGVQIADLSWTSDSDGWLLGATKTCSTGHCAVVLHTTDGGAHWAGGPAPDLAVPVIPAADPCAKTSCVLHIRFASQQVGYVYGDAEGADEPGQSSAMTTDGGRTWKLLPGTSVIALEPGPSNVLRVVDDGGKQSLQSAAIGSTSWSTVQTGPFHGLEVQLLRAGDDDYLIAYQHTAGGAEDAHTQWVVSHDGGKTWSAGKDPCLTVSTASGEKEIDSAAATALPGGTLSVLCEPRAGTGGPKPTLLRSTDAGYTFTRVTPKLPANDTSYGLATNLVQFSSTTYAAAESSADGISSPAILRSTDGGATFQAVQSLPQVSPSIGNQTGTVDYAGAQDGTTARLVTLSVPTVYTTTNSGASWTAHSFG